MTVYMKFLNRAYTIVPTFYDTEENIRTGSNACSHSIWSWNGTMTSADFRLFQLLIAK
jgi:hypothetical protein